MIQNTILTKLLNDIQKEEGTERFKLLEQLEMFTRSIATLRANDLIVNVPFGDDKKFDGNATPIISTDEPAHYNKLIAIVQRVLVDYNIGRDFLIKISKGKEPKERLCQDTAQKLIDAGILTGIFDKPSNK